MASVISSVINGGGGGANAVSIPYGYLYKTNNTAQQTILAVNTPIKVTATTTHDTANSNMVTSPSSNRLTYTGSGSFKGDITLEASGYCGAGGAEFRLSIYKNGSALNSVVYSGSLLLNASYVHDYSLVMPDTITTDDYYEVWVEEVVTGADLYTEMLTLKIDFEGWV